MTSKRDKIVWVGPPDLRDLLLPIRELKPYPGNPRAHEERSVKTIAESLARYGQRKPVVLNLATKQLEAGHGVREAAITLGWTHLATVRVRDDAADALGYNLVDNRAAELSKWNDGALAAGLTTMQAKARELPTFLGWTDAEIGNILGTAPTKKKPAKADADAAPALRSTSITHGDVFKAGAHIIACVDAKTAAMEKLKIADVPLMLFDPPYCSGAFQEAGRAAGTFGNIASDNLSTRGFIALLSQTLEQWRPQTVYCFTDWRMWIPLYDLVEAAGLAVRSMIVWNKGTPGLGALWRTQHELVLFGSRAANKRIKGRPSIGNVVSVPALDSLEAQELAKVIDAKRTGNKLHYTEKPVAVIDTLLANDEATERGKCRVVDPFGGSGTTLIAAENRGRACVSFDVEPQFVQVQIDRWEHYTGQKVEKLGKLEGMTA